MKSNLNISVAGIAGSIAVIFVAVVIIIIATWIHKRKNSKTTKPAQLPKDTDWGKELTEEESTQVNEVANRIYKDLKGINWLGHDLSIYKDYLKLSDTLFVAVANQFAAIAANGESLKQWINDETWSITGLQAGNAWKEYAKTITERLTKLGL